MTLAIKDQIAIKSREKAMKRTGSPESNIILFTSAKGGSGCSFLANSIASYMALKTTSNICLLDMNIGRSDSRIVFDVNDRTIKDFGDIENDIERLDTGILKKVVINLESTLNLIVPPLEMNRTGIFKRDSLNRFIECLRDHFDIICIDMPAYLYSYIDMAEIDIADRFVFISLPDILSVNNNKTLIEYLEEIRPGLESYLVINKYNMRPAISPTGLANILKYPVASFIPYDRDIEFLVNTRGPAYLFNYNLRIARSITGLSRKIIEELGT